MHGLCGGNVPDDMGCYKRLRCMLDRVLPARDGVDVLLRLHLDMGVGAVGGNLGQHIRSERLQVQSRADRAVSVWKHGGGRVREGVGAGRTSPQAVIHSRRRQAGKWQRQL